jgi:hypothetical protein
MFQFLVSLLRPRLTASGLAWLDGEIAAAVPGRPLDQVLRAYTAASRQAGRGTLRATEDELQSLRALDPDLSLAQWTIDDVARAVLLLAVAQASPAQFHDAATGAYEHGDSREQQSWLRALPAYPKPERFLSTAIDACRTNIVPLFEAIACENPFPARCFPERNFNQLVLKALFNGIAMARIMGLSTRLNHELSRMAADYAAERRAAGRSVPADISVVMATAPASAEASARQAK